MENYWGFCMREIKVIGLILPLVLGIKFTLFPWPPDRLATSKQKKKHKHLIDQRKHLSTHSLNQASLRNKEELEKENSATVK